MSKRAASSSDAPPLTPAPLEPIFQTILNLVKDSIDTTNPNFSVRNACVHLLHNYAILNKEAAGLVRQEISYAPVIWYERIRLGWTFVECRSPRDLAFFLEGLPKNKHHPLPIFGAPVAFQLPAAKCKDLTCHDVVDERLKALSKIDCMKEGTRFQGLVEQLDKLPDVAQSVPQRVRMFVSRMRSVCNGVREARPRSDFTQCRNVKCERFFYCGNTTLVDELVRPNFLAGATPTEFVDCASMDPANEGEENLKAYWEQCGGIPEYKDPLKRFCTSACCIEWRRQLDRCIPQKIALDPEDKIKKVGLSRIGAAMAAALRRNAAFSQQLKDPKGCKRGLRKAKAVSGELVSSEIGRRIDMLNIDLAILYWSNLVSGCPENIYNRDLPGDRPGWRSQRVHIKTARTLTLLYTECQDAQGAKEPKLITDLLKLNRFLARIKSQATQFL